jgi:putative ABC transport system substrate-binding protein
MILLRRRDFIGIVGVSALMVAGCGVAFGQTASRLRRVGLLSPYAESDMDALGFGVGEFRRKLGELGWVEGGNLRIDSRWSASSDVLRRTYAKELVALQPDVILSVSTPVTAALQKETRDIPIVFSNVADPLASGLVSSYARPTGNLTGFSNGDWSMGDKWLQLLKKMVPSVDRVGILFNPETIPNREEVLRTVNAARPGLVSQVLSLPIHDEGELDRTISAFAREPRGGLIIPSDTFTHSHRQAIADFALRHHLPTIFAWRPGALAGCLMSYGGDRSDQFRRAAGYVDRILHGAKPADLPVQGPTKLELVINLKTAKALGLKVPQELLARADEVIE